MHPIGIFDAGAQTVTDVKEFNEACKKTRVKHSEDTLLI
jgi:hypothetical protein